MLPTQRATAFFRALPVLLMLGMAAVAPAAAEEQATYTLQADGLACPFCAYGIEKQLLRIEGVESVETHVETGTVVISMEPGATLDEADAQRAVESAGFTPRSFRRLESGQPAESEQ